jgi:vacuolar-type H+-ATPase subunit H
MDEQKAKLKQLILDAESLMQKAKAEARQIVDSAEMQATELVEAARHLHAAAESEAAQVRTEAEEARRRAESEAQRLAEDAKYRHLAAIEEARAVTSQPGPVPEQPLDEEAQPEPDDVLREASEKADHMLRVARSEAKARADELIETARRRAAQIDDDARLREEVAAKQFRQIKRSMQDEQLELKSRIAELRAELRTVEAELSRYVTPTPREVHIDVESARTPPESADPVTSSTEVVEPGPSPITDVLTGKLAALEAAESESTGDEQSDEYSQAIKRFRRRA